MRTAHYLLWSLPFVYLCLLIFSGIREDADMVSFEKILLVTLPAITATLVFYIVARKRTILPVLLFVAMTQATAILYLISSYHLIPFRLSGEVFAAVMLTIALPYALAGYLFRRRFDELEVIE